MATRDEIEAKEKELEIQERIQALEARKLENAKLRREHARYELEQAEAASRNKNKAQALADQRPENKHAAVRRTCNHRMGGKGRESLLSGRGNSGQYAVAKIKLPTGDVMIRCPRCRMKWLPPNPSDFVDAKGQPKLHEYAGKAMTFAQARDAYDEAYNFETESGMIGLPQLRWSRRGQPINREVSYRFAPELVS